MRLTSSKQYAICQLSSSFANGSQTKIIQFSKYLIFLSAMADNQTEPPKEVEFNEFYTEVGVTLQR